MRFNRLVLIRKKKKLTQMEIAKILSVERSTYSCWETGKNTITLNKLYELSNYYKISIDYIVGLSNKNEYFFSSQKINLIKLGKNLKEFRIRNNLKQKDIINLLEINKSTYSLYENGYITIQTAYLFKIAKKFKLSIDELIKK